MFIGHFGVGFASKRFAPRVPLVLLLVAALLPDILGPVFSILGWEHARIAPGNTRFTPLDLCDYPWSHSLLMMIIWATLLALIYRFRQSDPIGIPRNLAWRGEPLGSGLDHPSSGLASIRLLQPSEIVKAQSIRAKDF